MEERTSRTGWHHREPSPPTFDVVDPVGRRVSVVPHADTDTIGDLAHALGLPRDTPLVVDGRTVAATVRLCDVDGLRHGSAITLGENLTLARPAGPPVVEYAVVAGPACTRWQPLTPGRHWVGRAASASVSIADPALELHHGTLDVSEHGEVTFTQLAGRVPARVGGRPLAAASTQLTPGALLALGRSQLALRVARGAPPACATDDGSLTWRRRVRRGTTATEVWAPAAVTAPDVPGEHPPPPATALVGAGVAAVGALVMATVVGQPLFAVLALIGASAAVATWGVGAATARRRRRRDERVADEQAAHFRDQLAQLRRARLEHHERVHPSVADALTECLHVGSRLWSRRDPELRAVVGIGEVVWRAPVDDDERRRLGPALQLDLDRCESLAGVNVPLELVPGDAVALHGEQSSVRPLARALVLQLATWSGPADWRLAVVTADTAGWGWTAWLPHASTDGGHVAVIAADDVDGIRSLGRPDADERHLVIVLDESAPLADRAHPIRQLVDGGGTSVVALVDEGDDVPARCGRVVQVGGSVVGIDETTAERCARSLAALEDPECPPTTARSLPEQVTLADLERLDVADTEATTREVLGRWERRPGSVRLLLGQGAAEPLELDLDRDGPHALVAGTTGAGKSELLRGMIVSAALRLPPEELNFVLVDYKGGAAFDSCAGLPHVVGLLTDLDEGLARRVVVSLEAELRRRERVLRDHGASDVRQHRDGRPLARLVVIVDELAALTRDVPDFVPALVAVAQRGRSLGVHLVLATQRPAGVVTDDVRANTNLRIALRVQDRADALDVVGDPLPAGFSSSTPGRAVVRRGAGELVVVQTALASGAIRQREGRLRARCWVLVGSPTAVSGGEAGVACSELQLVVGAIVAAARRRGVDHTRRPWLDPLPEVLDRSAARDLLAEAGHQPGDEPPLGVVDDPPGQSRHPLDWDPQRGNLLLVGAAGSGTTTAMVAVAVAACRRSTPAGLHLYVLDASGDTRLGRLGELPHCAGIVRADDLERRHRLLQRLRGALDGAHPSCDRRVLVCVDGWAALRGTFVDGGDAAGWSLLERVLRDGSSVGVSTVLTLDASPSSASLAAALPCAERWVFRLGDPNPASSSSTAGARTVSAVGPSRRPPGRLQVASSALEAQVCCDADEIGELPTSVAGRPDPIDVLPAEVDPRALPESHVAGSGTSAVTRLVVGLAADDLGPAGMSLRDGDHLLVAGPAGSGRSTTLRQLVAAWQQAHRRGVVIEMDAASGVWRCEQLATVPRGTSVLVAVDDADLFDDDGHLAALVDARRPGCTLIAVVRTESLRGAYGHWTRALALGRRGVLSATGSELDGEPFGSSLPRRVLPAPRPGLAWLVDGEGPRLVQVAARMPT